MKIIEIVSSHVVPEADRMAFVDKLFGINFPMRLEPTVYDMAGRLAADYSGGFWEFYALSNGGFYMAPNTDTTFDICCENGFVGQLSGDALGIAACLYAYSHLSFKEDSFGATCGQHYHLLSEFMFEHREARGILGAID